MNSPASPSPIPIKANTNSSDSGYKISVRFGDEVLQAGFTSVPNLVLNHYAELGVTPAEMMFTIHMWQFRWTERDPYPSLTTIADKMDVSWRQAHRYAKSLEQKGFLNIKSRQEPGRGQVTSEYDFESLIRAVVKLEQPDEHNIPRQHQEVGSKKSRESTPLTKLTEGGLTEMSPAPLTRVSDEVYKAQQDPSQEDVNPSNIRKANSLEGSEKQETGRQAIRANEQPQVAPLVQAEATMPIPPYQTPREGKRGEGFASIGATLAGSNLKVPPRPYGEERQVIMDYVARFAKEFNDHASLKTSTTRAFNLFKKSGLPLGTFIGRMYEAQAITKESAASVPRRPLKPGDAGLAQRGRPAKNKMAYFYACLEDRLGLRKGKDEEKRGVQQNS